MFEFLNSDPALTHRALNHKPVQPQSVIVSASAS